MASKNKGGLYGEIVKKIWTTMATSLVAVTSMVSAEQWETSFSPVNNNACCDAPSNSCCDSPCGHWSADIDFLYWTACQGGLAYGSESRTDTFGTGGSVSRFHTKLKHPHQRWDVGFRVGLGYQSACDCWDATLIYTNFDTDAHARHEEAVNANQWFTPAFNAIPGTGVAGDSLLGGNGTPGSDSFPVQFAYAHWKLRLNLLDLEIGREFCVNSCLSLRPFIGVRAASINEKYDIRYETQQIVSSEVTEFPDDRIHLKNNFEGAGVRGGLDSNYDLGCGLSLYGGVAASLLYGETEIRSKEVLVTTASPTTNVFEVKQKDNTCGCRAITDAEIGVRWQKVCCNKVIAFQVGWEHHFFFNQNQFEKFTNFDGADNAGTDRYPQDIHGDLSVQGLVVSARVHF